MGFSAKTVFLCPVAVFFLQPFDLYNKQEKAINSAFYWKNISLCYWEGEVNVSFFPELAQLHKPIFFQWIQDLWWLIHPFNDKAGKYCIEKGSESFSVLQEWSGRSWWESHSFFFHFNFFLLLNLLLSVSWICSSYVEMCKKPKLFQFGFSWPPPKIWLCVASFKLNHADCGCGGKGYHFTAKNWGSLLWVHQTKLFWPFWCAQLFSYWNCSRNVMYLFTPLGSNIVRNFFKIIPLNPKVI